MPHSVRGVRGARPRHGQGAHRAQSRAGSPARLQAIQSRRNWRVLPTHMPQPGHVGSPAREVLRLPRRGGPRGVRGAAAAPRARHHDHGATLTRHRQVHALVLNT